MRGEEEHTECVGEERGGRETGDDTVNMRRKVFQLSLVHRCIHSVAPFTQSSH